jgi:hypothetical protein
LTLDFYPAARLRLAAERTAFFIVNVHGIGDAPPDYVDDSAAVIQASIPRWDSPFSPLCVTRA